MGLLIFVVVIYLLVKNIRSVEMTIRHAGVAGPLVAIIIYGLFAVTPITTDPLTVVCGVIFGPFLGVLVSWLGNNVAATVEYYVGQRIGKATNLKKKKKDLPFILRFLPIDSPWFLILGRLIPGYGGKLISITAGIYHVPLKRYIWTTVLVNLLGSLLLAFGGYQIIHLFKF